MDGKINQIVLKDYRGDDVSVHLVARIDEDGDLVLEGQDVGKAVEEYWGDSDYEYVVNVKAEFKDSVLLYLIKERFTTSKDFMDWLDDKRIPKEFSSWA